jgi:hypothetical protein
LMAKKFIRNPKYREEPKKEEPVEQEKDGE